MPGQIQRFGILSVSDQRGAWNRQGSHMEASQVARSLGVGGVRPLEPLVDCSPAADVFVIMSPHARDATRLRNGLHDPDAQ